MKMPILYATKKREKDGEITALLIEGGTQWESKIAIISNLEGILRFEYRTKTASGRSSLIRVVKHSYLRSDTNNKKGDCIEELPKE
jgi:hypothetical protein